MKYHLLSATRALGLLPLADRLAYLRKAARAARGNRRFRRLHPDFAVPPADLAFDAYNKVDWADYHGVGLAHARLFASLIDDHLPDVDGPSILEWGCGPGRLIRHMPALLARRSPRVIGTDYNPRTIAWCQTHLPGITFAVNRLAPPLPFPDASIDATFNFSVFTHLSSEMHDAWIAELRRVLKPGGLLVTTTHGDHYRYLLTRRTERDAYDCGGLVTQQRFAEGKKWYFALHPPAWVEQRLLADFDQVRRVPTGPEAGMAQDVWTAVKPHG